MPAYQKVVVSPFPRQLLCLRIFLLFHSFFIYSNQLECSLWSLFLPLISQTFPILNWIFSGGHVHKICLMLQFLILHFTEEWVHGWISKSLVQDEMSNILSNLFSKFCYFNGDILFLLYSFTESKRLFTDLRIYL